MKTLVDGNIPVDFEKRFLLVGEYHFSAKPCKVSTVLGSCVTVTMFDPVKSIGSMCHGLLPKCQNYGKCNKDYNECFRYVECSIWAMLNDFKQLKIPRSRLQVKVFGGATIIYDNVRKEDKFRVGKRNIEAALKVIEEAKLNVVAYDFGGGESRKLTFRTDTGEVVLKRDGLSDETRF
ncbi:MAG: chemotaxis protein CheD [Proteobacteria bacterium]|nr:chemotaxis protein CheD [Pseudomonadota bacterium]